MQTYSLISEYMDELSSSIVIEYMMPIDNTTREVIKSEFYELCMNANINIYMGFELAIFYGSYHIVKLMIDRGANDFNYGLLDAINKGNYDIAELMVTHGATNVNDALLDVSYNGNVNLAKLLIKYGANNFNISLYNAAIKGNVDVSKLLIESGANNFTDVLYMALKYGKVDIIKLIKQYSDITIDNGLSGII